MRLDLGPQTLLLVALLAGAACADEQREAPSEARPTPTVEADPPADPPAGDAPPLDEMRAQLLGKPNEEKQPEKAAPVKPRRRRRVRRPPPAHAIAPVEPKPATTLSDYDFQQTITEWRGIKNCLLIAAGRARRAAGRGALSVEFEIDPRGRVVRSNVKEPTSRKLARCVQRGARRLEFPSFAANDTVTKQAKFVF